MKNIIAETIGMDIAELREYRYQPTRTTQAIYAIGDMYFAQGIKQPKDDVGKPWVLHSDQFWAERAGTKMWVAANHTQTP